MTPTATAFVLQSTALSAWASDLGADEWAAASSLPNWTIRDLVSHVVIVHESLVRTLATGSNDEPIPLASYVSTYSAHADELERLAQGRAETTTPRSLLDRLEELRGLLPDAVGASAPVLASARGPVAREDFLRTRVLEATVHADDLGRSLPERPGPALVPDAVAITVGVLLEALAGQRPGTEQEVVVPGVRGVAVAGAAGRFELEALAALRLFTGRLAPADLDARTDPAWGPVLA